MRFLILALLLVTTPCLAAPVLLFSDLDSGPATGNGDTSLGQTSGVNGVIVTVYGYNLGSTQGASTVMAGGQAAAVYGWGNFNTLEVGGGDYQHSLYDSHKMQKVSFQIPAAANSTGLTVTVGGETSNILPFTVRSGNIYFVDGGASGAGTGTYADPWQSPASYVTALSGQDGATCYFKGGVYNGEYATTHTGDKGNFRFNGAEAGTEGRHNAFIGYPGESVTFDATGGTDKNADDYFIGNIYSYPYNSSQYLVFASLRFTTNTYVARVCANWRFIGNLCIGGGIFNSGTGILTTGSLNVVKGATEDMERYVTDYKIYGNVITGERTANKLNHAVYLGSGKDNDFGWNYVVDNNVAEGPLLSINNEDSKENNYMPMNNQLIHDNVLDMSAFPSRAIGIHEIALGSDVAIYNNLIIGPTYANQPAANFRSSAVDLYNNTFYDVGVSSTTGAIIIFELRDALTGSIYYPEYIKVVNNLVYASSNALNYLTIRNDLTGYPSIIVVDHNLWYGIGEFNSHSIDLATGADTNSIESDPNLVDPASGNFRLTNSIPGTDLSTIFTADIAGATRSVWDVGAYEGGGSPTPSTGHKIRLNFATQ